MSEIWILGASGRSGRAVARELAVRQAALVLVGRDANGLNALASEIGGTTRILAANSLNEIKAQLSRSGPVVVANFIGPFAETALPIVRACAAGSHYLDLSNELPSILAVLALHEEACAAGRCLVGGAGFGVLATESVVLKLCENRPPAVRVRVDAVPFVDSPGRIGPTVAASVIEGLPAGGRRYADGQLVRAGLGSDPEQLTLPDGSTVATGAIPSGDLEAARRASGAPFAVAASSMVPGTLFLRAMMPVASALLSLRPIREFAKRRLANVNVAPVEESRKNSSSWAHARVEWADGSIREGWLRAGEAMGFTARVAAEVAFRLSRDEGRPGAYTPGALFGFALAAQAGGEFLGDAV